MLSAHELLHLTVTFCSLSSWLRYLVAFTLQSIERGLAFDGLGADSAPPADAPSQTCAGKRRKRTEDWVPKERVSLPPSSSPSSSSSCRFSRSAAATLLGSDAARSPSPSGCNLTNESGVAESTNCGAAMRESTTTTSPIMLLKKLSETPLFSKKVSMVQYCVHFCGEV